MPLSLVLCVVSFIVCFLCARRSLVAGLISVVAIGYGYGIARANVQEALSHFIFDAGVFALYCAQLFRYLKPAEANRVQLVRPWLEFLVIWPLLLFLVPNQDTLIRFVGLRGNIFLLPFILLGARLSNEEKYWLAIGVAVLNIGAFAIASIEFFTTIETFFPRNEVTRLIYLSRDVAQNSYRIPSTFTGAHAYAGTMVVGLPLLLGALQQKTSQFLHKPLLIAGVIVSLLGVLLAATRVHFIVAVIIIIVALFSIRSRFGHIIAAMLILVSIGWWVSSEQRLQRFMGLQDVEMVSDRVAGSVNKGFLDLATEYPFGNGLGGGGTSIPYFLSSRIENPVGMENEYARIMLEQGLVGLFLWIAFLAWLFTRRGAGPADPWFIGRRLAWVTCAAYFATGLIGTGLLTSVPQSCLLLLNAGWIASRLSERASDERVVPVDDVSRYPAGYDNQLKAS